MKYIVHFGYNNELEINLVRRYAEKLGYDYKWENIASNLFTTGTTIKYASMAVIWNGLQAGALLATRVCKRKGIPVCYIEWGLLPQTATFLVDPYGFCGDSILAKDVSWVTEKDMERLYSFRLKLQKLYPLQMQGHVLATLQIENDSQVLYQSPYRNMYEFISDVEDMYPSSKIIARSHPRSSLKRTFNRAEVNSDGNFFYAASKASVVVGITSTCLYEAAILGVPVVALGDHPLRIQPKHLHDRVLAGILALRIDREKGDLSFILNRFRIKPL